MPVLTLVAPIIGLLVNIYFIPLSDQLITSSQTNCPSEPSLSVQYFSVDQYNTPEVRALEVNPHSGVLTTTLNNQSGLYRFNIDQAEMLPLIQDDDFSGDFFAWSPDGRRVASLVASSGQVGIWDAESRELYQLFDEKTPEPTRDPSIPPDEAGSAPRWFYFDVAWSPNGLFLAAVGTEPLRVWDVERQQLVFAPTVAATWWIGTLNYRQRFSDFLAWSPDGAFLALAEGNVVHVWETHTWQEVENLTTSLDTIHTLAWSGNSFLVAGGAGGSRLAVWETSTWEQVGIFDNAFQSFPELPTVYSVAWSLNGCWLAVGASGTRIFILNAADGTILQTLEAREIIDELTVYQALFMSANKLVWSLDSVHLFAVIDGIISE